jgi:hypothetical protein
MGMRGRSVERCVGAPQRLDSQPQRGRLPWLRRDGLQPAYPQRVGTVSFFDSEFGGFSSLRSPAHVPARVARLFSTVPNVVSAYVASNCIVVEWPLTRKKPFSVHLDSGAGSPRTCVLWVLTAISFLPDQQAAQCPKVI